MKEFMLYIRNESDHMKALSVDQHQAFLKACETYIIKLKKEDKLIPAQPLVKEGTIISNSLGKLKNNTIISGPTILKMQFASQKKTLNLNIHQMPG